MVKVEQIKKPRQVPKSKEILANKKYYDILYGYLQYISEEKETSDNRIKRRVFYKKDINFSKLGRKFGLTRQTVSTKFKNLLQMGLVIDLKNESYELLRLDSKNGFLIPYETLKILCDTLSENCLSAYTYLLNRYCGNKETAYKFTLQQVKSAIGIADTTRSNDDIITNILFVLQKLGLLRYSMTSSIQEDEFKNVKTIYQIEWMTNELVK